MTCAGGALWIEDQEHDLDSGTKSDSSHSASAGGKEEKFRSIDDHCEGYLDPKHMECAPNPEEVGEVDKSKLAFDHLICRHPS